MLTSKLFLWYIEDNGKATAALSSSLGFMTRVRSIHVFEVTLILVLQIFSNKSVVDSFSLSMRSSSPTNTKTIYDVPNSGWTSLKWNWGYAVGTGHDCALICRNLYKSRRAREILVHELLLGAPMKAQEDREPKNFEEIKLVLALAWQRGRWDGSDGGKGGYGEILAVMVEATRYESNNEDENCVRFVQDMMTRFPLLSPSADQTKAMAICHELLGTDNDAARRKCSGLVLQAMGFVENGL